MSVITIAELKQQAGDKPLRAAILAQIQSCATRTTKTGKPFLELALADSTGHLSLKIWSDSPCYAAVEALPVQSARRVEARWTLGGFGFETADLAFSEPDAEALGQFFAGDPDLKARQDRDFAGIQEYCSGLGDPRLAAFCGLFLDRFGDRFRRSAAARRNHHARRGGLVEHVCQMMRAADALCAVYSGLNRDLLITGVLVHDCGKLWENCYPERGFNQSTTLHGEMLGHIPLGIELANHLWRELADSPAAAGWENLTPATDEVRLHLLHLIGSHHGQHEYGSPVLPRTPEAFALHYIDNLDAKLEMVREAYANSTEVAPGIHERVFPLPAGLVKPLPVFTPAVDPDAADAVSPATADSEGTPPE